MFQFTASDMQSTATTLFSAYASFAAFMMMFRSLENELIPEPLRSYLQSFLLNLFQFSQVSSSTTIIIDEQCGFARNEVFDAAETYLRTKISPTTLRFKVSKTPKNKNISINFEKNEEIKDTFENFNVVWKFINPVDQHGRQEDKFFELSFDQKFRDRVLEEYLPHVLSRAKEIKNTDKVVKLYTTERSDYDDDCHGVWGSISLDHPSTFETLAMDPETKKEIIEDLERFLRRRDYYKKVGKAWKRGYLLYGPPGTGKSSLIAAMANYLKFDIYDLELTSLYSNSQLRNILVSTNNRSIIVIEDIDCSAEMHDREDENVQQSFDPNSKLTLSGLLNFIDGLWSSCGDERIIVFTTNHKDKLDPALLRPGRMDLHIHMSYCTFPGFRILASNYLGIEDHYRFFGEIEELLENVQVTPAEIAEELMKSEDVDVALAGVVKFLKLKKIEACETKERENVNPEEEITDGSETTEPGCLETGIAEKRAVRGLRRRRFGKGISVRAK